MDLALNNLQRLICHKTQQTKPNTQTCGTSSSGKQIPNSNNMYNFSHQMLKINQDPKEKLYSFYSRLKAW